MKSGSFIINQTNGLLFSASSYAVMPVVFAKEQDDPKLIRPKDLSVYPEESKEKQIEKENIWEPTIALGSIQKVREEIVSLNQRLSKTKDRVFNIVQTGVSHTESFVDDLRQEKNYSLRAGFVAGGGLAGLLVAVRKGIIKKLVYTTTGASVAFYVGYPKESKEATKVIKRYSIISYHLVNNVTKDLTGFELPSLPTPKEETETKNDGESKPDLKELLFSIVDNMKESFESLKKTVFNKKEETADKKK